VVSLMPLRFTHGKRTSAPIGFEAVSVQILPGRYGAEHNLALPGTETGPSKETRNILNTEKQGLTTIKVWCKKLSRRDDPLVKLRV
jgi:hypothetical protein